MSNYTQLKSGLSQSIQNQANSQANMSTVMSPKTAYSKMNLSMRHTTGFNSGEIIPIYHEEMLPGDTFDVSMNALVRTSMPKASTLEVAIMEVSIFFVPNRFLWLYFTQFMGEKVEQGPGPDSVEKVPCINFQYMDEGDKWPKETDLGAYLGIPVNSCDKTTKEEISALPIFGYAKVFNDWYRSEFFQDCVQIPSLHPTQTMQARNSCMEIRKESGNDWWSTDFMHGNGVLKSCKLDDLFTMALPWPQMGDAPSLSIRDLSFTIPKYGVGAGLSSPNSGNWNLDENEPLTEIKFYRTDRTAVLDSYLATGKDASVKVGLDYNTNTDKAYSSLYWGNEDITANAKTNLNVNDLREVIAAQHFLEINARSGTRYVEYLNAHFGISVPSLEFGRAELVGSYSIELATQNVIQTSASLSNSPLGTVSGIGMNGGSIPNVSYTAKEHGQFYIMLTVRPVNCYPYGLPKKFSRTRVEDYYVPSFDKIGEQPIRNKEIYFANKDKEDNEIFGFQIPWYDYKYANNLITGPFHPNAKNSIGKEYKYFEEYDKAPTLNENFIFQSKKTIGDTLLLRESTYEFGVFQYIIDANIKNIAIRPMSYNGIPGLNRV